MSGVYVDLSEFEVEDVQPESGDFKPPKPGEYVLKALEAEWGTTQKGDKMLTVRSEILGNLDRSKCSEVGKHVWARYTWSNNEKPRSRAFARGRFRQGLEALGVDISEGFNTDDVVGKTFSATVTNRSYSRVKPDGTEEDGISADLANEQPIEL